MYFDFLNLTHVIQQIGLAIVGASSIWGLYFMYHSNSKNVHPASEVVYAWIAEKMILILNVGVIFSVVGWLASISILDVYAIDSSFFVPTRDQLIGGYFITSPLYTIWVIALTIFTTIPRIHKYIIHKHIGLFYYLNGALASILLLLPVVHAGPGIGIYHFSLLGWHLMLTVGTAIVFDILLVAGRKRRLLAGHIYPHLQIMTVAMWIGLFIQFLLFALSGDETVFLGDQFKFMQILVGILIINGVLLGGPFLRRVIHATKNRIELSERFMWSLAFSGGISIVTWIVLTFLSIWDIVGVSISKLWVSYILMIAIVVVIQHYIVKREEEVSDAK